MLLMVIAGVVLVVSAVAFVVAYKVPSMQDTTILSASLIIITFSSLALLIMGTLAVIQAVENEPEYQSALMQRQSLEYRLSQDDLKGNELLYQDINEFNMMLQEEKYWASNLWVNVFYNWKIAELDYIDYTSV